MADFTKAQDDKPQKTAERLALVMKKYNLSASQLAVKMRIQPGGVSHLLSARNDPRAASLRSLVEQYPNINLAWLLGVSDKMYIDDTDETQIPAGAAADIRKSRTDGPGLFDAPEYDGSNAAAPASVAAHASKSPSTHAPASGSKKIERIVIFYDDNTFESFESKNL